MRRISSGRLSKNRYDGIWVNVKEYQSVRRMDCDPPEVKWVDAGCSMNQLSALKYVEVQNVYVLLSIMYPPKKVVITDSSQFWNVEVLVGAREGRSS